MKYAQLRNTIAAALLLTVANLNAAAPADPVKENVSEGYAEMERAVHQQVNRYVVFPIGADGERLYGTIDVEYAVNTAGRIDVISASSHNAALRDYVMEKLQRINIIPEPTDTGRPAHLRFTFRPE